MLKIVIMGGGSSGTTCAFELRKLNKEIDITIIEQGKDIEYSPCSLPYLLSGEIQNKKDIFILSKQDYKDNNINILLNTEIKNMFDKEIVLLDNTKLNYDYLVYALGSVPNKMNIEGVDNCYFFKSIQDFEKIEKIDFKNKKVSIIGGGLIGVEVSYALMLRGAKVQIIEYDTGILPKILDSKVSGILEKYLVECGINLIFGQKVEKIDKHNIIFKETSLEHDFVFFCAGLSPNLDLAKKLGLKTNMGIIVDTNMKTSKENIFACGDCVESMNQVTGKKTLSMLGTTAVRQAKIIAKNIWGVKEEFPNVINATITKVGKKYVGFLGITKKDAKKLNLNFISANYTGGVVSDYYPSKDMITYELITDYDGIVLGCQIISDSNISGHVDLISLVIKNKINIRDLCMLETCYNPACAPIFNPLLITAEICLKKIQLLKR